MNPILWPEIAFVYGILLSVILTPPISPHCQWLFTYVKALLFYHQYSGGIHKPTQLQCYRPTNNNVSYYWFLSLTALLDATSNTNGKIRRVDNLFFLAK